MGIRVILTKGMDEEGRPVSDVMYDVESGVIRQEYLLGTSEDMACPWDIATFNNEDWELPTGEGGSRTYGEILFFSTDATEATAALRAARKYVTSTLGPAGAAWAEKQPDWRLMAFLVASHKQLRAAARAQRTWWERLRQRVWSRRGGLDSHPANV